MVLNCVMGYFRWYWLHLTAACHTWTWVDVVIWAILLATAPWWVQWACWFVLDPWLRRLAPDTVVLGMYGTVICGTCGALYYADWLGRLKSLVQHV